MNEITKKQLNFAREYVLTGNASEAYRRAYNAENMSNDTIRVKACNLLKKDNIRVTVEALNQVAQKEIETNFKYDVLTSFKKLETIQELALTPSGKFKTLDLQSALRAEEMKGRLYGLYVDKKEVDNKISFTDFLNELDRNADTDGTDFTQ